MCRMLIAQGNFSVEKIIENVILMSEGETAVKNAPVLKHRSGWGVIWQDPGSNDLHCYRNNKPFSESYNEFPYKEINPKFLAIHTRHATLPKNLGLQFTHPLEGVNQTGIQWYIMHNGFLPTVCSFVGLEESKFDTKEYFDFIIPKAGDILDKKEALVKLQSLPASGTSANAFIINKKRFYVVNWSMPAAATHPYYMIRHAQDGEARYISSEVLAKLVPVNNWHTFTPQSIQEYAL